MNVAVRYGASQVRTSQLNADELAVELVFERGIAHLENMPPGKKKDTRVYLRIEQSPAGGNAWVTVFEETVIGRQVTPLYWGRSWRPTAYQAANVGKNWDVRVSRLVADYDEERNFGNFSWIALRTMTWGDPTPVPGVAMLAMRIRSSEQLQGVIDTFNVVARTIARDWDAGSGTWVWRPTSSPAALFRHVLQHPARERPATDEQIDLARLQYWDGVTRPAGREFNGVIEAKGSLYEVLIKLGRVGRAVPSLRDLRFSVLIDEPRTTPVRLFTPRNSWGYDGEMTHAMTPHAYRIGYVDAAQDWRADEVLVYDDGYDAGDAVRIDKVEWPGIIDRGQAWREGRFHLAQQRLRREVHRIFTDFEQLACERGDLVALQHDVIAVGLGGGRITARTEVTDLVTALTLDSAVTMQAGKSYALRVRRVVAGAMRTDLYQVLTVVGEQTTLTLKTPPQTPNAPAVGDLAAFGELGRETLRVLIRDIEPQQDLAAKLTLIAEAPGVHAAEAGAIPPLDPLAVQPPGFAAELEKRFGAYKTMGWAIDTWSIQSGTLDEAGFLEDVRQTAEQERRILAGMLAEKSRLLFHYFEFPDRVGHVFWRFRDPEHPAYDAKKAALYGDAVEKSYATMDAIVGDTAKALGPDDVLIVLSDHGFATWRRSVNYNSWLVENGYLVLKGNAKRQNLEALFSRGQFWEAVDWPKSKAYAMGLGDIYVNLKGREADGLVNPGEEYEALRRELTDRLTALTDPKNGRPAVSRVFRREDVYRRFNPRLIPDLIVANRPGYRVSWQSSLGVPTETVFEDNRDVWSGDHCSLDPDLVRGVFFASRPFHAAPVPGIADVTASVRALVEGAAVPEAAGHSLW